MPHLVLEGGLDFDGAAEQIQGHLQRRGDAPAPLLAPHAIGPGEKAESEEGGQEKGRDQEGDTQKEGLAKLAIRSTAGETVKNGRRDRLR